MHMVDALLSPAVGASFLAGSAAAIGLASKKLREQNDDKMIPLMGVLGAFVFAAQMINFTIPGTGSSGHLGGGILLAILLGPSAGFLVIASVLTVQALFFADGGLLALGANIWNLGVYPCFIVYPLLYRPLAGDGANSGRVMLAAVASVVLALQLGAFSVVLQTLLSGKSELPFNAFVLLMQPIHLAIGIVEGIVTAGVIRYVRSVRPEILDSVSSARPLSAGLSMKKAVLSFLALAIITGGALSWFASSHPDGLEWSLERVFGEPELPGDEQGVAATLKGIQEKTAVLPDYAFRQDGNERESEEAASWPAIELGTSVSGFLGAVMVLALSVLIGIGIRAVRKRAA